MTVRQISVFLENRPAALLEFTKLLEENSIDLRALSLAEAEDFGIVRIIVDDSYKTMQVLKDAGYVCNMTKVLAVEVEDKPGALVKVLNALGDNGVNLEYTYAFLSSKKGSAFMIMRVADNDAAVKALSAAGIMTVCQDDLGALFQ
ncbi:MAG: ACT domain-containing protein [Lachnospiraceae bacterium]|nr:ACT domain-containing protein [Lachnospiraceae bacterium]